MQTLFVKGADGKSKTVQVHRSFQDISGAHIFQHTDGTYGYKDGSPVRKVTELEGLPPEHRILALAWWKRTGEKSSTDYYAAIAEKAAIRAGDFQEKLAADEANTALDSILYARRTMKNDKKIGAISAPKPWMEFGFTSRPDWWGQAKSVAFTDCAYEMQDPVSEETVAAQAESEAADR